MCKPSVRYYKRVRRILSQSEYLNEVLKMFPIRNLSNKAAKI
jgi:hypothetical protein